MNPSPSKNESSSPQQAIRMVARSRDTPVSSYHHHHHQHTRELPSTFRSNNNDRSMEHLRSAGGGPLLHQKKNEQQEQQQEEGRYHPRHHNYHDRPPHHQHPTWPAPPGRGVEVVGTTSCQSRIVGESRYRRGRAAASSSDNNLSSPPRGGRGSRMLFTTSTDSQHLYYRGGARGGRGEPTAAAAMVLESEQISRKVAPSVSTSVDTFSCLELASEVSGGIEEKAATKTASRTGSTSLMYYNAPLPSSSSKKYWYANSMSEPSSTRNQYGTSTTSSLLQEGAAQQEDRRAAPTSGTNQKEAPAGEITSSSPFSETPAWFPAPSSSSKNNKKSLTLFSGGGAKSPGRRSNSNNNNKTDSLLSSRLPSRRSLLLQKASSPSSVRSFANSSITSYATGDEELLSMAGDSDLSFLEAGYDGEEEDCYGGAEEEEFAYYDDDDDEEEEEEMACSIATDPNVIAIGIPAGPSALDQARLKDQALISEVVANDIAEKEHSLKMRGADRAIIERRLSSPCCIARPIAEQAKKSTRFSSFASSTRRVEQSPRSSDLHQQQKSSSDASASENHSSPSSKLLEEQEELLDNDDDQLVVAVNLFPPPKLPTSSRSMESSSTTGGGAGSDDIKSQESFSRTSTNTTPGAGWLRRGRKEAILANPHYQHAPSSKNGGRGGGLNSSLDYSNSMMTTGGEQGTVSRISGRLPNKSHSMSSCSPPIIPVRRKSGYTPHNGRHDNEVGRTIAGATAAVDGSTARGGGDDWDAQTESAETANGASVATFSSGIDLDDKTRNNIISHSSSIHIARRRSSMQHRQTSSVLKAFASASKAGESGGGQITTRRQALPTTSSSLKDGGESATSNKNSLAEAKNVATEDEAWEVEISASHSILDDKKSARGSQRSISGVSRSTSSTSSRRKRRSLDEKASFRKDASSRASLRGGAPPRTVSSGGLSREEMKARSGHLRLAAGDPEREQEKALVDHASSSDDHDHGLPFGPVMASDILPQEEEDDHQGAPRDLEAQAGVPVVLPGAFAVRPISSTGDQMGQPSSGYDSGFEDLTVVSDEDNDDTDEDAIVSSSPEEEDLAPEEQRPTFRPVTSAAPLEAELYEVDYAQAQVVDEVADDAKAIRKRVRLLQTFFFFLCLAIGTGIAMAVLYSGKDSDENCKSGSGGGDCIPTIRGWDQLGDLLTGPTESDSIQYGYSVAMSGDGYRVAIGLPGLDGRDDEGISSQVGGVFILDFNGTDWTTTVEFRGLEVDGNAGTAVVISEDGKRVAFGAPGTAGGGYVAMYQEESDGVWGIMGDILGGSAFNGTTSAFGTSLALSSDGEILAVGDKYASFGENMTDVGTIRMYQQLNGAWEPLGQELRGVDANELFGWSIALSQDGQRVAASAVGAGTLRGEVRVFDFENGSWVQAGQSLSGEADRDTFGAALALGDGGDIMAIGATGYSKKGSGAGRVTTYKYDAAANIWRPMGAIDGDADFDRFGSAVALSQGGDTLAIGSPENDVFGTNSGFVKVMRYDGSGWSPVGSKLGRLDSEGGLFGSSIALSSDGKQVAGGAPELTYDGKLSKVGRVWIYERVLDSDA